jgi:hypothetical protein
MVTRAVWYRYKETGEIYSLWPPEPPFTASWGKVEIEELKKSGGTIQ